jgi:ABC-type antimicrobial peptide transport system permease subunit
MRTNQLLKRNLTYFWRTNLAVVLGVATAVAVLAGALLVGDSVRGSLRDLFVQRLGNTDHVITANGFFRDQLASDIQKHPQFRANGFVGAVPLIAIEGTVTSESSRQTASNIQVYGVDQRFWAFHGRDVKSLSNREILLSDNLADELGNKTGDSVLVRIEKPSDIPIESLHSKKDDLGRTLRLDVRGLLSSAELGEFSIQPQQSPMRAVFVPLSLLQKELEQEARANLILIDEGPTSDQSGNLKGLGQALKDMATLEDYGLKLRVLDQQQAISLESSAGMVPEPLARKIETAAKSAETSDALPYLSYLINSIRKDDGREIPYSIITGLDSKMFDRLRLEANSSSACNGAGEKGSEPSTPQLPSIIFNQWAASDLQAGIGDRVTLDYYVWLDEGKLATRSREFRVACIVPMTGLAADRDLVPDYPGITESETLGEWDPPFPIDLKRIRPQDEEYWKQYRTTPKGFILLEVGQGLWQSRFGRMTSLRVGPPSGGSLAETRQRFERSLRETLDPLQAGFIVLPVRAQGLEASRGATDFGEYFLYFSFFLVVSALLLTALFFKLGVEQRLREIGLLQAIGFPEARLRRQFVLEGLVLAVIGSVIGLGAALGYGQLMMTGLNTWWKDAVGTNMLRLHVAPVSLLVGATGGIVAAVVCIAWTLRRLRRESTRGLLTGTLTPQATRQRAGKRRLLTSLRAGNVLLVPGIVLLVAGALGLIGQAGGFFGGGVLLLAALLCFQSAWLRRDRRHAIHGNGWLPVSQLGFRNATFRPGRSVLCIALIASAAFIIVSVDAFRRGGEAAAMDRKSGTGGYPLLAESLVPLVHDPNTPEGREAMNLPSESSSSGVTFTRFRVRPGDDASCLNLYQPRNPRIIAPGDDFVRANRFTFQKSIAQSDEEKTNPWLLLNHEFPDGAIPIIADANSLAYVLHLGLGDDFILNQPAGPFKLRVVASLADSVFQSELMMSDKNFLKLFPEQEGYSFFLIDTPAPGHETAITAALEQNLSDFGFDVTSTAEKLANFHRVENTYLSTFQMLGGLGLLLGTVGLGAVLLRNVFERRRELALLRAVGYNSTHFTLMVVAENALLLFSGLLIGAICALLAIAPVFFERGGRLPNISLGVLLLAVLISGLTASLIATWAALKSPLLPALKAE